MPSALQPPAGFYPVDCANSGQKGTAEVKAPDISVQGQLLDSAKLLAESQNQNRLPVPKAGVFNGNLLQYPIWIKAFETLIESRAIKPVERLHFLGKYVDGKAKELVDGFMFLDSEDAYQKAKEMLAKRFGDPFSVAAAKITQFPANSYT